MRYIPSPIPIKFELMYSATANRSGRMQYHKIRLGHSKVRISRNEFIKAYNSHTMLALKPSPLPGNETDFQIEFYV